MLYTSPMTLKLQRTIHWWRSKEMWYERTNERVKIERFDYEIWLPHVYCSNTKRHCYKTLLFSTKHTLVSVQGVGTFAPIIANLELSLSQFNHYRQPNPRSCWLQRSCFFPKVMTCLTILYLYTVYMHKLAWFLNSCNQASARLNQQKSSLFDFNSVNNYDLPTCIPILNWRIQHKLPKKYQTQFIWGS